MRVNQLDHGVSKRQAFGAGHQRPETIQPWLDLHWSGKLRLSPHPAWKGDVTEWESNPFADNNWQFQHQTLRWLNPLRWSALEGDEKAKDEWIRIVRSWYAAHVPATKAKNPFSWRHMADGTRALALSLGSPLLKADDQWYVELLTYHRDWLTDPAHIVGKNHGLHQHLGLLVVAAVLRDKDALNLAVKRMTDQFQTTFDEEGTNDEGSAVYHQLNLRWWSDGWDRANREGVKIPDSVEHRLGRAADVLAQIALPNGELPQIGDSARQKLRGTFSDATRHVASGGSEGTPLEGLSKVLRGGYVVSRSGWGTGSRKLEDESHTLVRYGKELGAHSHRDRGSVHIYAHGKRWLVDSGFYSYQKNKSINNYLRRREAHNVSFLSGLEHDADAPVELTRSTVTTDVHDFVLVDKGYLDASLQRRILYFPSADFWIISDRTHSESKAPLVQHWHLEPGVKVASLDNGFRLAQGGDMFGMYWLGQPPKLASHAAKENSHRGWISSKWKTLEASVRLTARNSGNTSNGIQMSNLLLAPHKPMPLGVVYSKVTSKGVIALAVTRGERYWRIRIDDEKVIVKSE